MKESESLESLINEQERSEEIKQSNFIMIDLEGKEMEQDIKVLEPEKQKAYYRLAGEQNA